MELLEELFAKDDEEEEGEVSSYTIASCGLTDDVALPPCVVEKGDEVVDKSPRAVSSDSSKSSTALWFNNLTSLSGSGKNGFKSNKYCWMEVPPPPPKLFD